MKKIIYLSIIFIIFGGLYLLNTERVERNYEIKSKQGVVYLFNNTNNHIIKGDKIHLAISEKMNVSKVYHDQEKEEMRVVTDTDSVIVFSLLDENRVLVDGLMSFKQSNFNFMVWYNNFMKSDDVFDETICEAGGIGSVGCTLGKSNIMVNCKSGLFSCCSSNINFSGCISLDI